MSSARLGVGLTVVGAGPGCDTPGAGRTQLCGSSLFLMRKLGLCVRRCLEGAAVERAQLTFPPSSTCRLGACGLSVCRLSICP